MNEAVFDLNVSSITIRVSACFVHPCAASFPGPVFSAVYHVVRHIYCDSVELDVVS